MFCPLFRFVLPQIFASNFASTSAPKDKRKTLARDDVENDDVFSNDDDDDEFGVVLEITNQKTPITAH